MINDYYESNDKNDMIITIKIITVDKAVNIYLMCRKLI